MKTPILKVKKNFEKRYFKIFGSLFNQNGVRFLRSYQVSIIDDFNEVSHHFLECTLVKLKFLRGVIPDDATAVVFEEKKSV